MIYLYPLAILALSFNMIAAEREAGALALVLSQPIRFRALVLGKLGVRALLVFSCGILVPTVAALVAEMDWRFFLPRSYFRTWSKRSPEQAAPDIGVSWRSWTATFARATRSSPQKLFGAKTSASLILTMFPGSSTAKNLFCE
jgi:hypothetical protein